MSVLFSWHLDLKIIDFLDPLGVCVCVYVCLGLDYFASVFSLGLEENLI